jgi:Spy/CpxP family protein refolding chaperone
MKGGHEGCGMGPGMVGGQGRGHGMMGSQGQGHGMMGGPGPEALEKLGLGDEQRGKVREIHRDLQRKNHALMGSMRDLRWQSEDAAKAAEFDETAARKRFDAGAAIRKQMFEARLEARKQVDAVLTKEQREKLRQGPKHGPAGPGAHH